MNERDYLTPILARKRAEIGRRRVHADRYPRPTAVQDRAARAVAALRRRPGEPLRAIAEIKLRSPSAGQLRPRVAGSVARIARGYADAGAAAVSILCDGPGFGGTPLDLRRAAAATDVPLLFKEFVLDEIQLSLAHAMGAHMVLLLVRAMPAERLRALVDATLGLGMAPVVEAADAAELEVALETPAPIVGVNARDLRTFRVDMEGALSALAAVPEGRVAVHMSGVREPADVARASASRADAALIGEGLMRAADPAERLRELLASQFETT